MIGTNWLARSKFERMELKISPSCYIIWFFRKEFLLVHYTLIFYLYHPKKKFSILFSDLYFGS